MRLTKKDGTRYFRKNRICDLDLEDKLGQLEDFEDELGIDLIVILKALKQHHAFRVDEERVYVDSFQVKTISTIDEIKYVFYGAYGEYNLKKYCKKVYGGWALTEDKLLQILNKGE